MGSLDFTISYRKNEGLIMSPSELIQQYFFGVPLRDPGTGQIMSNETVKQYIVSAQQEVEKSWNLKLTKQIIQEQKSFYWNDFTNWAFVRTTYPVVKPFKLDGYVGTTKQIEYPEEWLSSKQTTDGELYHRQVFLVPTSGATATSNAVVASGILPHAGFLGNSNIPNYWTITYCTGFNKIPSDLLNFVGKLAAINIFNIMGDLILGAGIASQSVGIDGLSQSISSTSSATNAGYGARIINYANDLKQAAPKLAAYYKGISFTVC